jgi:hypothetical protein
MLDEYTEQGKLHLTRCGDPFFTSYFRLPFGSQAGVMSVIVPPGDNVAQKVFERTYFTVLHERGFQGAMDALYATALAGVRPGPDWLHDVAMIDYDYLSRNGEGWFRDIDALTEAIRVEDRPKVLLALHGWYDGVGRYCFNSKAKNLDKTWIAFPSARTPEVQAKSDLNYISPANWPKRSIAGLRPVPMSIEEVRRRLQYARKRGFRAALYFADGLNACDGFENAYDPSKVLRPGGWTGPDTKGKVYAQNPLHPEVYAFYTGYLQALLANFGSDLDGLIWDETFVVGANDLGTKAAPGFVSVAMMKLVREVAAITAAHNPQLAFFASDCLCQQYQFFAPYALQAHGTYQDLHSGPESWGFGLFPNYRNVLWSCNWNPVTKFHWSQYGTETFDVPVSISAGACGDDLGFADLSPEMRGKVLDLFGHRKSRRMQITWIEEEGGVPTYQGRALKYRYTLYNGL